MKKQFAIRTIAVALTFCAAASAQGLRWIDVHGDDVEGRGWSEGLEKPFDRIPKRFASSLPSVWGNGVTPTGMFFEFESDTTTVSVRTEFGSNHFGENNFNFCAFSGTDLYVFDESRGDWRWAGAAGHGTKWQRVTEYSLTKKLPPAKRRFRLYLPLRNRLLALSLGVDDASQTKLVPPRTEKPIVYYGTSIIHGAYNIRPGLALTSRL